MRKFLLLVLVGLAIILGVVSPFRPALALSLKQQIAVLDILRFDYGTNTLQVQGNDLQITKGDFNSEAAGEGDVYLILAKEKDRKIEDSHWKVVRYFPGGPKSILTITAPHTYEDSIMSVRFLVPKGQSSGKDFSDVYLLKAERDYLPFQPGSEYEREYETVATFTLYQLQRDDDFGIFYLKQVAAETSKKKYCNVDWAMYKELNVALPDGGAEEYDCSKWLY